MGTERAVCIEELEARVAAMRRLGVTKWGDIELGPLPQEEPQASSQPTESLDVREQRARDAQKAVSMSSSARLVRRLG